MSELDIGKTGSRPIEAKTFAQMMLYWCLLLLLTLGISGLSIFSLTDTLTPGIPLTELLSYKFTGYSNLLLIASSLVYIAHLKFQDSSVGKWASGLAAAGMSGIFVALLTRWYESYQILEEGHVPISNLYEVSLCFTALTVTVYLILESLYRNRSAGAFVMPIVLGAVGLQEWLVATGYADPNELVPALKSYWMHAHVLANFIGYGAFAVSAGAAVMLLVRQQLEKHGKTDGIIKSMPPLSIIDDLMYRSVAVGFPVFTLAVILGSAWAYYAWGGYWSWDPKETWSLIVLLVYAAFLHARFMRGWAGIKMAWWSLLGFSVTLFCFLGVNLFLSGLHSYGAID